LNDKELIEKRRNNYLYILGKLMGMNFIKVLFPVLDDDICPLFFPILIKGNRNQFKEKLIGEKIYCPIHWPVPIQIKVEKYKNSFGLYRSELSIPCDQRYGISDMERIVSVIKSIN
jgi:dTDP-4-amino-4,6-dideoxygalactose transaminase